MNQKGARGEDEPDESQRDVSVEVGDSQRDMSSEWTNVWA